jgi:hypothetical protein
LHIFAKFSLSITIHWCANDSMMANSAISKIRRGWKQCRSSSQRKRRWTSRQGSSFAEKLNFDSTARYIAVA